jgi:hypothetical protein
VQQPKPSQPEPLTGTSAFGADPGGGPTGAQAVGAGDAAHPLRGALAFGNDPAGDPRGAQAVGGADSAHPLRGALQVGNDSEGSPRGAQAFGGQDVTQPLRGALAVGNDASGDPRGSVAVGGADAERPYRGTSAFGSGHGIEERLFKDAVGYDFGATLLIPDAASIAGVRKATSDGLRARVLSLLKSRLDLDRERLRHGLGEDSIKWGRLRDDPSLDRPLAEALRADYRRAPGEVLGIAQVRDVLERTHRMHTFRLSCPWELGTVTFEIEIAGQAVARAESRMHKDHAFFLLQDLRGRPLCYADRVRGDSAPAPRILSITGEALATVALTTADRLRVSLLDERGRERLAGEEQHGPTDRFLLTFAEAGKLADRLGGAVHAEVQLDVHLAPVLAWAMACILVDLAHQRHTPKRG